MNINPGNMRSDGEVKGKVSHVCGNICQCHGCFKDTEGILRPGNQCNHSHSESGHAAHMCAGMM